MSERKRERECDTHTYIYTAYAREIRERCIEILFRYYTAAVVVVVGVVVGGNILPLPFWPFTTIAASAYYFFLFTLVLVHSITYVCMYADDDDFALLFSYIHTYLLKYTRTHA